MTRWISILITWKAILLPSTTFIWILINFKQDVSFSLCFYILRADNCVKYDKIWKKCFFVCSSSIVFQKKTLLKPRMSLMIQWIFYNISFDVEKVVNWILLRSHKYKWRRMCWTPNWGCFGRNNCKNSRHGVGYWKWVRTWSPRYIRCHPAFDFDWSFGYETAIRKMGSAFSQNWLQTQSFHNLESVFDAVQRQCGPLFEPFLICGWSNYHNVP